MTLIPFTVRLVAFCYRGKTVCACYSNGQTTDISGEVLLYPYSTPSLEADLKGRAV